MMLEKTLESPLHCKEIQPVHPKADQFLVFIGGTDVETETPILWHPDAESWLIWKNSDVGKEWGQEEKGTTEDEMVGWHHRLYGHEFEQVSGVGDGQGGLMCCSPWGCKEMDTTEQLNWADLDTIQISYLWKFQFEWKEIFLHFLRATFYDFWNSQDGAREGCSWERNTLTHKCCRLEVQSSFCSPMVPQGL